MSNEQQHRTTTSPPTNTKVPRIEAKKMIKRASELAQVRSLLVECGVDAQQWFDQVLSFIHFEFFFRPTL
jgi:hypothetical protein